MRGIVRSQTVSEAGSNLPLDPRTEVDVPSTMTQSPRALGGTLPYPPPPDTMPIQIDTSRGRPKKMDPSIKQKKPVPEPGAAVKFDDRDISALMKSNPDWEGV